MYSLIAMYRYISIKKVHFEIRSKISERQTTILFKMLDLMDRYPVTCNHADKYFLKLALYLEIR